MTISGYAQQDSLIIRQGGIAGIATDSQGNLYASDIHGNLTKYDTRLQNKWLYSPERKGALTSIDTQNPLKILVFYSGLQQFHYLDRFMVASNQFVPRQPESTITVMTSSTDNLLWLIDMEELVLKKYDPRYNQVILERPFDLLFEGDALDIYDMKEYNGRLYIAISENVLIFDLLGNYLEKLQVKGLSHLQFYNEYLYYTADGKLLLVNLKNKSEHTLPLNRQAIQAALTDKYLFLLDKEGIHRQTKPKF